MKVTQGVLKYSTIYGVTFEDKYLGIKTIVATENFTSKFISPDSVNVSKTTTSLSDNNTYYNRIEDCKLINCNIKNGTFIHSSLIGISEENTVIDDGYFSGCTFSGYTINGGVFHDCNINSTNIWKNGQWHNDNGTEDFVTTWNGGVWNSGIFSGSWSGGTFNDGIFTGVWYDGVANGGIFSGITWYNGLVRNADFEYCTFNDGVFNNGTFNNSNFNGGNFNNGKMNNSIINGGIVYNGSVSNCTINNSITEIKGGTFTDITINNGNFFNIDSTNLLVNYGKFYSGNYNNSVFIFGDIYNGLYFNITGSTSGLTVHNGFFKNGYFDSTSVYNGNFNNCYSKNLTWYYGIYTEGEMYNSLWYNGYWNDGLFSATGSTIVESSSEPIIISPTTTTTTTTVAITTTTTTVAITTTTTSTTIRPSEIFFESLLGDIANIGINYTTGQVYTLTFSYNLFTECDNIGTDGQDQSQSNANIQISIDNGNNWTIIDSVDAYVSGGNYPNGQSDQQTKTGTYTVYGITSVYNVQITGSVQCDTGRNLQSGEVSAVIVSAVSEPAGNDAIIVCYNGYNVMCINGATLYGDGLSCTTTTTTTVLIQYWFLLNTCPGNIPNLYYTGPYPTYLYSSGNRVLGATGQYYVVVGSSVTDPMIGTNIGVSGTGQYSCP